MTPSLATTVAQMVDYGWDVRSQTETTASLETHIPFNWWLFAIVILLFPVFGGVLYVLFWYLFGRANVFVRDDAGNVAMSGDTWRVAEQRAEAEAQRAVARDIKQYGFWKTMGPSIITFIAAVVIWFLIVWAFVELIN